MQDNAPGHAAKPMIKGMRERGIYPIFWPPFSPDLNPIETVWNKMKDWIAKYYPEMMSYDGLRVVVKAAWDAFPTKELGSGPRISGKKCSGSS
jgi:hypothetical protein